ncbi:VirB4 family type IV secretion/conjugal transfer ATPase [Acidovorax facilis]|jgi:type IV secretion system protein VirB4|uniref:VirB4 family type IV secretion/conjugal transfer ATPase n=1 Tax=Acidovorax facilis TaxID=12917 RepID=UPI003D660CE2
MKAPLKFAPQLKTEVPTSQFIPYSSHVTRNIVKLTSGDFMFCMRVQGASHQSADIAHVNGWHEQLNGWLRNIASPHVAVWTHVVRREFNAYPEGDFESGFVAALNGKYRDQMGADVLRINELYVSVIYRPQPIKAARIIDLFARPTREEVIELELEHLDSIEDLITTTMSALDRYEPELLGVYERNELHFSEVCEFLAYLVDGEWRRFPLPRAEIRSILATARPFFGKGGLMSLMGPTHTSFAAVLAFQEYPSLTVPGLLNELLSMPFEFVLGQSFTFLSKPVARGRMVRQQQRMVNAGDVAKSQVEAIDQALDDLTSNHFVMGAHSLSLVVRANSEKALKQNISDAGSALSDVGIKWAREDAGMAGGYWSLLPGNFEYRIRLGDITSRNFAGFSSLHNYPLGRIAGNQWGPAVAVFKTEAGAPYYFSFHKGEEGADARKIAKLDPNHKELANTVVIGKSGTGKTVLETFLLAQLQKFNRPPTKPLSCVLFDKDLGAAVAVRAMGGRYFPLKNGVPSGFNPFQLEPTPNNLTFLEGLVRFLVRREGMPLSPSQEKQISSAIQGVMNAAKKHRRLSAVMEFLDPTDADGLCIRLERWCRGGPLGWLLDNEIDTLNIDECPIMGFDVTEFLDNDETRTPTIMYLMHRIESLFDGRRVAIFMDEFWKLLDDPAFEDLAKNKLVTIRKQDGFLAMFTQSPSQVLQSPIAFAIVGQTATKIFLPNPEADYKDYVEGFKVTKREFELIKSLGEKSRKFLIKQGSGSVIAELNMRGFEDELAVLSGNTATSLMTERLVSELGTDPAIWLPEFHLQRRRALSA